MQCEIKLEAKNEQHMYLENVTEIDKREILTIAMEECAELQQALSKEIRNKGNIDNICEEIADVIICIEKVIAKLDLDVDAIDQWKKTKINRLENTKNIQ